MSAVSLVTLGCKVNQADSEQMAEELLRAGHSISERSAADVVIVNTCCVTAEAERKARKAVRRILSEAPSARVVVTGCMAVVSGQALGRLGDRVEVVEDRSRVAGLLGDGRPTRRLDVVSAASGRTRVGVKVQDGCDCECAYCVVPLARGRSRSIPADEVVRRVEGLVAGGVREVVLTGVNLAAYEWEGMRLADLVERVVATGVERVRMSSIEPDRLDERLVEVMSSSRSIAPHLHVPLQSGSDAVLERMMRPYRSEDFLKVVSSAAESVPGLAVTTDVITGFPGETDEDHRATLAVLEELRGLLNKAHVFRFSAREGTAAAKLPDKVDPDVCSRRAAEVREKASELGAQFRAALLGRDLSVLVERVVDGVAEGTSAEYVKVRVVRGGVRPGDIVECTAVESAGDVLVCA
ncbi:MAG: tRNA (N(6)-L-threonylcarbamoyladenosine(37)-C(2))-methylthiotransferase MtaB [Coriobacteriia bacterium]